MTLPRDPAWLAQAQDCFDKHVRYSSHTGYREAICDAFATLLATVDTAAREEGRAALEAAETPLKVRAFDWLRNRHCPHYEGEPSHWPPEWVESLATLLAAIDTAAEARGREAERDQVAWLIERHATDHPEWVSRLDAAMDDCIVSWTRNANFAIRFARRLDCERVLPALGGRFGRVFPTEHVWCHARPTAPARREDG